MINEYFYVKEIIHFGKGISTLVLIAFLPTSCLDQPPCNPKTSSSFDGIPRIKIDKLLMLCKYARNSFHWYLSETVKVAFRLPIAPSDQEVWDRKWIRLESSDPERSTGSTKDHRGKTG